MAGRPQPKGRRQPGHARSDDGVAFHEVPGAAPAPTPGVLLQPLEFLGDRSWGPALDLKLLGEAVAAPRALTKPIEVDEDLRSATATVDGAIVTISTEAYDLKQTRLAVSARISGSPPWINRWLRPSP